MCVLVCVCVYVCARGSLVDAQMLDIIRFMAAPGEPRGHVDADLHTRCNVSRELFSDEIGAGLHKYGRLRDECHSFENKLRKI